MLCLAENLRGLTVRMGRDGRFFLLCSASVHTGDDYRLRSVSDFAFEGPCAVTIGPKRTLRALPGGRSFRGDTPAATHDGSTS